MQKFDEVTWMMEYEAGELRPREIAEGFARLVASGLVWSLQGFYGRTAARLIEAGVITRTGAHGPNFPA
jgi:hypothetical protein